MDRVFPSAAAALDGLVEDGMTLAVGGFGQRLRTRQMHKMIFPCVGENKAVERQYPTGQLAFTAPGSAAEKLP